MIDLLKKEFVESKQTIYLKSLLEINSKAGENGRSVAAVLSTAAGLSNYYELFESTINSFMII